MLQNDYLVSGSKNRHQYSRERGNHKCRQVVKIREAPDDRFPFDIFIVHLFFVLRGRILRKKVIWKTMRFLFIELLSLAWVRSFEKWRISIRKFDFTLKSLCVSKFGNTNRGYTQYTTNWTFQHVRIHMHTEIVRANIFWFSQNCPVFLQIIKAFGTEGLT